MTISVTTYTDTSLESNHRLSVCLSSSGSYSKAFAYHGSCLQAVLPPPEFQFVCLFYGRLVKVQQQSHLLGDVCFACCIIDGLC